jgi:molybdopterin-guanine dinucleotide biosynthesis protein MobB
MKIFGLAGWSGAGKTTLVARLLPALIARGISVSTVKHAHESFDIDKPGKDSHTHRMAGAREVMISSIHRWALIHEHRGEAEPGLDEIVRVMAPVDLLLVEGFKRHDHDKLEIHRATNGKPFLFPDDPHIVAIASDGPVPGANRPVLDLNDADAIAVFVLRHTGLGRT